MDELNIIWGTAGYVADSVHMGCDGADLNRREPGLTLRPGRRYTACKKTNVDGKFKYTARHRLIRFSLPNWNAENENTCPECRDRYEKILLERNSAGLTL